MVYLSVGIGHLNGVLHWFNSEQWDCIIGLKMDSFKKKKEGKIEATEPEILSFFIPPI